MKRVTGIVLLFLSLLISSCEYEESDYYNFKVISTGTTGFNGYYIVDGDTVINFDKTTPVDTPNIYEVTLSNPTSVLVHAVEEDPATTSISVQIYQNSKMVASETQYQSTENTIVVQLYHEFSSSESE